MTPRPSVVVAENVRSLLARRRIRQRDVAIALGMTPTTFNRRVSGEVAFDVDELQAIASYLDIPVPQLLDPAMGEVAV